MRVLLVILLCGCWPRARGGGGNDGRELIRSGTQWTDDGGNPIHAHAGGMLRDERTRRWYWYGETRKGDQSNPTDGVNCYSAEDLTGPWHFEGEVISQNSMSAESNRSGPWIIQRPKVLYNNLTDRFVMWFHLDMPKVKSSKSSSAETSRYLFRRVGVATAETPAGPFRYRHSFRPNGWPSLDINLFADVDGKAYLIRDCAHQFVGITQLSPDFLETEGDMISRIDSCEGMAMFRLPNGTYYVLTSHLTSWDPNPLVLWRSNGTTLKGAKWIKQGNPTGSETSFDSQPTAVIQYNPNFENREHGDTWNPYFLYMGDNWVHCGDDEGGLERLESACYVWLPMRVPNQKNPEVRIDFRKMWHPHRPFVRPATTFEGSQTWPPVQKKVAALLDSRARRLRPRKKRLKRRLRHTSM